MTGRATISPRLCVLLALGILAVLSAVLVVRGTNGKARSDLAPARSASPRRSSPKVAPPATVPPPKSIDLAKLTIPCWSCPEAADGPLHFRSDLDLLAPLGNGAGNAAEWFAMFNKSDGERLAEAKAAEARRAEVPGVGRALPAADPLLAEAEPWCDQATMRFYPDVFPLEGWETTVPNLLLSITFARSWVARGRQAVSYDAAMADFRRVIRLGRLLRQEDVVLLSDLVGLACIRLGAEAIYDRARREGHCEVALVAAVVAGEAAPQKLLSAARITASEVLPWARDGWGGVHLNELPSHRLERIESVALRNPDRRFRGEALLQLQTVATIGNKEQRAAARRTLEELGSAADPIIASSARWCLEHPPTEEQLGGLIEQLP